jgi:hypothetical protein
MIEKKDERRSPSREEVGFLLIAFLFQAAKDFCGRLVFWLYPIIF